MNGTNINGVEIYVPQSYLGILPVSPSNEFYEFEYPAFLGLKALVGPGSVVFDIGSSYGIMSCLMAHLTGQGGKVVAFEANPKVIEMAKKLVLENKMDNTVTFVNGLVSDSTGGTSEFFIVDGVKSVASTRNPGILHFHPNASTIEATNISIDDFVKQAQMVPALCKIDVEGAEYVALEGMKETLDKNNVDLVIETHGEEIKGIGGDLPSLAKWLCSIGYGLFDLSTGLLSTADEYSSKYSGCIGYALFSKKLNQEKFCQQLSAFTVDELRRRTQRSIITTSLKRVREVIEKDKDYGKAGTLLEEILRLNPSHGEANYLYAYCLHVRNKELEKAIHHYDVALENGFDEFWVRYNRGSLYADLEKTDEATSDIKRALEIKPNDSGCLVINLRIAKVQRRRKETDPPNHKT